MGTVFKLNDFDTVAVSEQGKKYNILNPITKEEIIIDGSPVWIRLYGPDSEIYKKENNKIQNGRIKSSRKGGVITNEVLEQENKKLVAKVIIDWDSRFTIDGEILEPTAENKALILQAFPWLFAQLQDFLGDWGNWSNS